jgi:hypothetical protein
LSPFFYHRFGNDLYRLVQQLTGSPTIDNHIAIKQLTPAVHHFLAGLLQSLVSINTYYNVAI